MTLCTAIIGNRDFVNILIDSVKKFSSLITEIIVIDLFSEKNAAFEVIGGKPIIRYIPLHPKKFRDLWYAGHALALHKGIEVASQEYVMFCDPDVFFCTDVPNFYFSLMQTYNLDYIGVSNDWWRHQSSLYFPCVINSLVKKSKLPDSTFLKNKLKFTRSLVFGDKLPAFHKYDATGLYLLPGPIPSMLGEYPEPERNFDVGCNLYYWSKLQNWRWVSFLETNRVYFGNQYVTNVEEFQSKEERVLLYHQRGSCDKHSKVVSEQRKLKEFRNKYREATNGNNISYITQSFSKLSGKIRLV